jgi:hypothetical protein
LNITKEKKILNYISERYKDDKISGLIQFILSVSVSGKYLNFNKHINDIVINIFDNDYNSFLKTLGKLKTDKLVTYDGNDLYLLINDIPYLYKIIAGNKPKKRAYNKNHVKGQNDFLHLDNSKTDESRIKCNELYQGLGFKVPEFFKDILTSKPVLYNESTQSINSRKQHIVSNITKETKKILLLLLSMCDSSGFINKFNLHYIHTKSNSDFHNCFGCYETFRKAIGFLLDNNIIEYKINSGSISVHIVNYKEMFKKGNRYVVFPFTLFNSKLKDVSSSSLRLLFKLLFQLNNGEDKSDIWNRSIRPIFHKLLSVPSDNRFDKEKLFNNVFIPLRKRCSSEIVSCIKELQPFFIFEPLDEKFKVNSHSGSFRIIIKDLFFVKKGSFVRYMDYLDPLVKHKKKALFIRNTFNNRGYPVTDPLIRSFTTSFNRISYNEIDFTITNLVNHIRYRNKHDAVPVRNIVAYSKHLYYQRKRQLLRAENA